MYKIKIYVIKLKCIYIYMYKIKIKIAFIPIPKKGNTRECSNYCTTALISHASKVMLCWFQEYVNQKLPDVQAEFRKGRTTRDHIANIHWIMEKQGSFRKTSISASLTTLKPLTMWIPINCRKFLKRWEYQATLPIF